ARHVEPSRCGRLRRLFARYPDGSRTPYPRAQLGQPSSATARFTAGVLPDPDLLTNPRPARTECTMIDANDPPEQDPSDEPTVNEKDTIRPVAIPRPKDVRPLNALDTTPPPFGVELDETPLLVDE